MNLNELFSLSQTSIRKFKHSLNSLIFNNNSFNKNNLTFQSNIGKTINKRLGKNTTKNII